MLSGQIFSFIAAGVYVGIVGASGIPARILFSGLVIFEVLNLLTFAIFLLKINKKFRRTFLTDMTAKKFSHYCFLNATSDVAKMDTFYRHPSYYKHFEAELSDFVKSKWVEWLVEPPVWWSEQFKTLVPQRMKPEDDDEESESGRRTTTVVAFKKERRASFFERAGMNLQKIGAIENPGIVVKKQITEDLRNVIDAVDDGSDEDGGGGA